ncbi:hypothetical protein CNYM01_09339 [Colletotrichum nymphaeae SA-01]|uniref:Uncharacterized protein n=1 Tax=Colletotrichum nymphaeae SA-01 TaxID=1460502 RepID=A0A135UHQ6_9PEZI|nr:hypothetical protein CNYM01_09339 [Colletotrichum nymphaeae SA-01]
MKFTTTLVAAIIAPMSVQACSYYSFCHCIDANQQPNDVATGTVCGNSKPSHMLRSDCIVEGSGSFYNCNFSDACKKAGATGDQGPAKTNAWCQGKQG